MSRTSSDQTPAGVPGVGAADRGQAAQPDRSSRLNDAAVVRLVASREVRVRLRSKSFRIITLVAVVLLVGGSVLIGVLRGHSSTQDVGLVDDASSLSSPLARVANALGVDLRSTDVSSTSAARSKVLDGTLDLAVVKTPAGLQVLVKSKVPASLQPVVQSLAQEDALGREVSKLAGNPDAVVARVAAARASLVTLKPPKSYDPQRLAVGGAAGILIYIALMFAGQIVAAGVVEEKSNRVVEVLLSTIKPWHLMAGKVAGIGVVSLIQLVVIGVAGAIAASVTGAVHLPGSVVLGSLLWLVVWFILGFLIYALVFAAVGALVSRSEDLGSVVAPVTMFIVAGYVVGISVLPNDPGNQLVAIMSIIPFFAPTLMPIRLAIGGVPWWETVVSLTLSIAMIPALVWLGARIYRNAVIRIGARVRLRAALRG